MATAYRHMGLGSPLQVMSFLRQRVDELKETVQRWEDENEMWAKVDVRPGDAVPAMARGHLRKRQSWLSEEIFVAKQELSTLLALFDAFMPCIECGGTGAYVVFHSHDDSKAYPCKACGGSGTRQ